MKARYKYRFYPTDQQSQSLSQLFGCVRVVWNDALAICKQSEKLPSNSDLQKLIITQAKKTEEREWLASVSNVSLQQSVADLGVAYKNFFDSLKGKRKGKRAGTPKFKWREFRVLCESKSEKFGRTFNVISRWEPTSQICSDCGYKWGKLDLSIRSVLCINCGAEHDRDENAAKNIDKVGIGHCHDSKRTRIDRKTTPVAS
jgi:putative transposase